MGSRLIIKDADFSENGIVTGTLVWYLGYDETAMDANSPFSSTNRFYIIPDALTANNLIGKTISYVHLHAKQAGTIKISTVKPNGSNASVLDEYSYDVTEGVNVVRLANPITFSSEMTIGFVGMNILSYWNAAAASEVGWEFRRTGATGGYGAARIAIDFGYMSQG